MTDPLIDLPALALSTAEFVALAGALGERVPEHLAARVAELPIQERRRAATAAAESLMARGIAIAQGNGARVRVPVAAARLIEITCRPSLVTEIRRVAPGQPELFARIASVADASVASIEHDGRTRYVPFATHDLMGFVGLIAGLADPPATDSPLAPVSVSLAALRAAAGAAAPDAITARLRDAGLPEPAATELGTALASRCWGSVSVLYREGMGRRKGGELAWVGSPPHRWQVPMVLTGPSSAGTDGGLGNDDLTVIVQAMTGSRPLASVQTVLIDSLP
jgi:hypothetical protein